MLHLQRCSSVRKKAKPPTTPIAPVGDIFRPQVSELITGGVTRTIHQGTMRQLERPER